MLLNWTTVSASLFNIGNSLVGVVLILIGGCAWQFGLQPVADQANQAHQAGPVSAHSGGNRGAVLPLRSPNRAVRAHAGAILATADISRQRIDPPRLGAMNQEPAIAAYYANGSDHLVLGWHHVSSGATRDALNFGGAVSHDSGQTWQTRIYSEVGNSGSVMFDPFAAADAGTRRLWLGGLANRAFDEPASLPEQAMYLFEAQGNSTLSEGKIISLDPFDDKPAAIFAANAQSSNGTLFITSRGANRRSNDLTQTFQRFAATRGIGHQPAIFPDGEIITIAVETDGYSVLAIAASTSINLGNTFARRPSVWVPNYQNLGTLDNAVPGEFRMAPFGQLALSAEGTVYYVFPDITGAAGSERNVDILLTKSTDRGASWSTPVVVNGDSPSPRDQFMPAIAVSPDGALHIAYMDTRRSSELDSSTQIKLDIVYARSVDAGHSFSETFITESPFDASTMIWRPYDNNYPQNFIGDYIGIAAPSNAVYIAYPDRRAPDTGQVQLMLAKLNFGIFADGFEAAGIY